MPITLRALAQDRHTLRIDYGDAGDLNIVYTPSLITEKLIARFTGVTEATSFTDVAAMVNETLIRVIVSWDMLGEDGAPLPLTPDGLSDVPVSVRMDILSRIVDEMRLGESSGTPSAKPSRKRS